MYDQAELARLVTVLQQEGDNKEEQKSLIYRWVKVNRIGLKEFKELIRIFIEEA